MAFNFRPTKSQQILNKKKPLAEEAAAVHEYVMSSYGVGIILDPTKNNFKEIKIPRLVEQQINLAGIKKALISALIPIELLDIKTIDMGFDYSDHQPVRASFKLL